MLLFRRIYTAVVSTYQSPSDEAKSISDRPAFNDQSNTSEQAVSECDKAESLNNSCSVGKAALEPDKPVLSDSSDSEMKSSAGSDNDEAGSDFTVQFYDVAALRKLPDYREAYSSQDFLIMGRQKETQPYTQRKEFKGRVFYPEGRNEDYSSEKNAAFWAGAIESQSRFCIVSPLINIAQRADFGLKNGKLTDGWLGGTARELLWLEDNGYTFEPDPNNRMFTFANPPTQKKPNVILRINYADIQDHDVLNQVARLHKITIEVAKKRYAKPESVTFFGYGRGRPTQSSCNPATQVKPIWKW